jgi:hypothetical protein
MGAEVKDTVIREGACSAHEVDGWLMGVYVERIS